MTQQHKDFQQVGTRIEELLGGLSQSADEQSLHAAEESVRLLVEMYAIAAIKHSLS